jgi:hypothetical protein
MNKRNGYSLDTDLRPILSRVRRSRPPSTTGLTGYSLTIPPCRSGNRLKAQKGRYGCSGEILARFAKEAAAYRAEVKFIAELAPTLNKHPGGNGSRAMPVRKVRDPAWLVEIPDIQRQAIAARV